MRPIEHRTMDFARFQKKLDIVCANKHVGHWFECDVVGITKASFWHEFEIKISVGDFRADFHKKYGWGYFKKHEILAHVLAKTEPEIVNEKPYHRRDWNDLRVPNYFWFVTPTEIAERVEIPAHAGHLELTGDKERLVVRKQAPRLHKGKVSQAMVTEFARSMEFKYYAANLVIERLQDRIKELEEAK